MTRISDEKMRETVLRTISAQLIREVARLRTHDGAQQFLVELLTDTERIMLAKRLAIVILLARGYSYQDIARSLKVSTSTIARYWQQKKNGEFGYVLTRCTGGRPRNGEDTIDSLAEKLLRLSASPIGRGRRQFLDEHFSD